MCATVIFCLTCIGCLEESFDNSLTPSATNLNQTLEGNREGLDWHRNSSLNEILGVARTRNRVNPVNLRDPFQYDSRRTGRKDLVEAIGETSTSPVKVADLIDPSRNNSSDLEAELRLIGLVEVKSDSGRIAVFSDGHRVLQGRLNEVVAGRYLIKNIRVSSVEIQVLSDGQTRSLTLDGI